MKPLNCLIVVLLLLQIQYVHAQQWRELGKKESTQWLEKIKTSTAWDDRSVHFEIATFPSYDATVPTDLQFGNFLISGQNHRSELLGVVTMGNPEMTVTVVEKESLVLVSDPAEQSTWFQGFEWDQFVLKESEILLDESSKSPVLRIVFPATYLYTMVDFKLSEKGQIQKTTTYLRSSLPLDDLDPNSKRSQPRVEVELKSIVPLTEEQKKSCNPASVVSQREGELHLAPSFEQFRIFDTRISSIN